MECPCESETLELSKTLERDYLLCFLSRIRLQLGLQLGVYHLLPLFYKKEGRVLILCVLCVVYCGLRAVCRALKGKTERECELRGESPLL